MCVRLGCGRVPTGGCLRGVGGCSCGVCVVVDVCQCGEHVCGGVCGACEGVCVGCASLWVVHECEECVRVSVGCVRVFVWGVHGYQCFGVLRLWAVCFGGVVRSVWGCL